MKALLRRFENYIYDPSISLKDRSFLVFSVAVLIALFLAIPCGLIMQEPPLATISTVVGAVSFTAYVIFAIRTKRIRQAKVVISVLLVFVFLPAMFFSNGGSDGGTPVWLLLGTIYISMILEGKLKIVMLLLNMLVIAATWIVGYLFPDLVTEYSRGGNYFDSVAALFIVGAIIFVLISFQNNLFRKEEAKKNQQRLFEQTAMALVNAIDAKDRYTHGHSSRVADYSRKIAEYSGKSPEECNEIYYAALLHDVGKIGIPEHIINKEGKLTEEEYAVIKQHPVLGEQILHSISEFPALGIGALYHHERYDGKGYPNKLIGTDIPEYARIISVADAYDAMTSRRSYRDPIPQQKVREEFVKGVGAQFDPDFARIMIHLIDVDLEYEMKEREDVRELAGKGKLIIDRYRSDWSEGFLLTPETTTVCLKIAPDKEGRSPKPVIVLFDSLDGRIHEKEDEVAELLYYEYGELFFDGTYVCKGARKMLGRECREAETTAEPGEYRIEALKIRDHVRIRISGNGRADEFIIALPDCSRYAYIGFSGEHCCYSDARVDKAEEAAPPDSIERIAEEISYINVPAGDIPNVQIDGYRTDSSEGIEITDGMCIRFHAATLPTARLVWHCPFVNIFSSEDGMVNGPAYRDLMLMRLDGECWESDPACSLSLFVNRDDEFDGWDAWKAFNKKGFDCTVSFKREGNSVTMRTENNGIAIKNTLTIADAPEKLYAAVTGDQCTITNIRIRKG